MPLAASHQGCCNPCEQPTATLVPGPSGPPGPAGPSGGEFYTFGNWGEDNAIPEDGTIITQAAWNKDTGHAFVNTNWPNTETPTWEAH